MSKVVARKKKRHLRLLPDAAGDPAVMDREDLAIARRYLRRVIADASMLATVAEHSEIKPKELRRLRDRAARALFALEGVCSSDRGQKVAS